MGAVKAMVMDQEEEFWFEVENKMGECEHVSEAMEMAVELASVYDLIGYLEVQDIEGSVAELWNEYWSAYQ